MCVYMCKTLGVEKSPFCPKYIYIRLPEKTQFFTKIMGRTYSVDINNL